ncbi:hypothetical protein CPB86DRAFT_696255 [Serendipita vermifera]|nr:hypothetical protein CPB86DRAFT_696255 [Serendipita vermifera]
MAPSKFAKSSGWVTVQHGPAGIDCMRPPERTGLPIALLHSVFANFIHVINQPMPSKIEFTDAYKTAWQLCQTMPHHFKDEKQRKTSFEETISLFLYNEFPEFTQKRLGQAEPDGLMLAPDGSVVCIMEIKHEPGSAGDVYMQSSCSYDAIARQNSKDEKGKLGHPALILCIDGPNIQFCGGYKDGVHSVVEPLSRWCSMLPDKFGERQEVLAKHLYAFKLSLRSLFTDSPLLGTTESCPRIYTQFQTFEGQTLSFGFISPYKPSGSHCDLMFRARYQSSEGEVLVKVVRGPYGVEAHRFAAEGGFAPRLYGVAKVDGAPPAYIMEFLSEDQGWLPLRQAFFHIKREEQWKKLTNKAKQFLLHMENKQLVHGDLRANNMLFRLCDDDDVELRILDWDWSGPTATVRYPIDRNPEAGLLGIPGGFIHSDHDSLALSQQLEKVKQSPVRSRNS